MTGQTIARWAALAAASVKGQQIKAIDVSERLALTDVFLLVTGQSERQVGAIAERIEQTLAHQGFWPNRREGDQALRWVLLDYDVAVIHVQHSEQRTYYALDSLWKDCPIIELPDISSVDADTASQEQLLPVEQVA